jgi:hypothetical protein
MENLIALSPKRFELFYFLLHIVGEGYDRHTYAKVDASTEMTFRPDE